MIIQGDALTELKRLQADSIDCCITSPPYFQLRDYRVDGQIGLEDSVEEYIRKLVDVFREVRRVLKKDGTLWINIADSYAGSGRATKYKQGTNKGILGSYIAPMKLNGCKQKDLIGIPWELAFALRNDGWYLRQEIIWYKPNCMPESVKDRCTKSHESIFLLSKSKKYYFDWESIQESCVGFDKSSPRGSNGTSRQNAGRRKGNRKTFRGGGAYTGNASFDNGTDKQNETHGNRANETGLRRKRSVWSVSTTGGGGEHYATFPQRLIEPCIIAGSRVGGVILDPFAGSGTTGVTAEKLNRDYILIELSEKNTELCRKRLKEYDL